MTNKEILIKAIKKAECNKFSLKNNIDGISETLTESIMEVEKLDFVEAFCLYMNEDKYIRLIFSHDFAKAFWGEKKVIEDDSGFNQWHGVTSLGAYSDWQVHLQRMILEKEPLKYLEKFL